MSCHSLSTTLTLLLTTLTLVIAETTSVIPLTDKHYAYPSQIPYQVDPVDGARGPQQGYNLCNSTTENQDSMCQTSFVNSLNDFCLWAPPTPDQTIGDTEGSEVSWCTKHGHGGRLVPDGAITGVQYLKTPDYVQVVGFINQSMIDIAGDDFGGELDPHGDDFRGNPLGGLMYSTAFSADNTTVQQVIEWHNFMGNNAFCIKVCDPAGANAASYCQHSYDRIGCAYNDPNNAQNGVFESCDSDSADFPGVYTSDGQVMTYKQPDESLGPISTIPYTARIASSSNCQTFGSQDLYIDLPGATGTPSAIAVEASASMTSTGYASSGVTVSFGSNVSGRGVSGSGTATITGGAGASQTANSASSLFDVGRSANSEEGFIVGTVMGVMGVAFAMTFLA